MAEWSKVPNSSFDPRKRGYYGVDVELKYYLLALKKQQHRYTDCFTPVARRMA